MSVSEAVTPSIPSERVVRHKLADRLYHWLMAASVLTLMATAFLPIVGWKFEWLTVHWTTGIVLAVLILIHIVRSLIWQDWRAMIIDYADIRNAWRAVVRGLAGSGSPPGKPGKYKIMQKLYHWGIAILILAIVCTGLLMLLKIDTPLWHRNPYWFADKTWGAIYFIHGFAAMASITMVMIHIYFALRPEEWWLTRSMVRGWITRKEFRDHCDSSRWASADMP